MDAQTKNRPFPPRKEAMKIVREDTPLTVENQRYASTQAITTQAIIPPNYQILPKRTHW
jgi:hypothetical protein